MVNMERIFLVVMAVAIGLGGVLGNSAHAEEPYRSPLSLATAGDKVFIGDYTARAIQVYDTKKSNLEDVIALDEEVNGLVLSPDGKLVYAAVGGASGAVLEISLKDNSVLRRIPVGHTPKAPVITPDGKTLLVCTQFNDAVVALDLSTDSAPNSIPVTREPVAAALTPDGKTLIVANLLPAGRADGSYVTAMVDLISVADQKVVASVPLTNGSSSLLGACVSPDGRYAYVTHILSRYQLPTTQLERGWINTNAVSMIDIQGQQLVNTFLLDDVDLGAANPWGITCSEDGQWLCVAHSGTHELSVIDRARLHEKLAAAEKDGEKDTVPNDLAFLVELRERVKLSGLGPRGLTAVGNTIFAAEYFSGTLAEVTLAKDGTAQVASHRLGTQPEMTAVRKGELFFHDGAVCFQQWQSCASCHPGDARVDALNWDILNDGMGNPKNTKSMLLSYDTPPTTATRVRDNAMVSTRAGIRFILFNQPKEEDALAVDAYLRALKPVPSPKLVEGKLSTAAERGKILFSNAKCASCHPAPLFTDLKGHKVGTETRMEPDTRFDTPSLVEAWRTAPYLHDGRAATIKELLTTFNPKDFHGVTSTLSEAQLDDLAEYILSL